VIDGEQSREDVPYEPIRQQALLEPVQGYHRSGFVRHLASPSRFLPFPSPVCAHTALTRLLISSHVVPHPFQLDQGSYGRRPTRHHAGPFTSSSLPTLTLLSLLLTPRSHAPVAQVTFSLVVWVAALGYRRSRAFPVARGGLLPRGGLLRARVRRQLDQELRDVGQLEGRVLDPGEAFPIDRGDVRVRLGWGWADLGGVGEARWIDSGVLGREMDGRVARQWRWGTHGRVDESTWD
jgi:hypothetical protein